LLPPVYEQRNFFGVCWHVVILAAVTLSLQNKLRNNVDRGHKKTLLIGPATLGCHEVEQKHVKKKIIGYRITIAKSVLKRRKGKHASEPMAYTNVVHNERW